MKYITKVSIQGFQSHADTVLVLKPGVNAITGPSDNGKSAVLRALRWALWNEAPEGDWMRKGCTLAQVGIWFSDGATILRERDKKRNKYVVSLPGQEDKTLVDFGTDLPAEVLQAHGMRPVPFDPRRPAVLNYASQLEAPFFLTASAPERARILGRLAGVHYVDLAKSSANSDALAISKEIRKTEAQAAAVDDELAGYVDLDDQEQGVAQAEELLREIQPIMGRIETLQGLLAATRTIVAAMAETEQSLKRFRIAESSGIMLVEAENAQLRLRPLVTLRVTWTRVQSDAVNMERILTQLKGVQEAARAVDEAEKADRTRRELSRIMATRDEVRRHWRPTQAILAQTKGVADAQTQVTEVVDLQAKLDRLTALRSSHQRVTQDTETVIRMLERSARQAQVGTHLDEITATQERVAVLRRLIAVHNENQAAQTKSREVIETLDQGIEAAAREYGQVLRDTGICPSCLQVISPDTAEQIAAGIIHEGGHVHVS